MSVRLQQVSETEVRVDIGDKVFIVAAQCPHRGGRLVYSRVNENRLRISCPLHHSTFDLDTGAVVAGASCHSLAVKKRLGNV
jgi:nitrite reductase/ring-hydroxylating ferredoxin subunit